MKNSSIGAFIFLSIFFFIRCDKNKPIFQKQKKENISEKLIQELSSKVYWFGDDKNNIRAFSIITGGQFKIMGHPISGYKSKTVFYKNYIFNGDTLTINQVSSGNEFYKFFYRDGKIICQYYCGTIVLKEESDINHIPRLDKKETTCEGVLIPY